MIPVRRLLITLAVLVIPLTLAVPDAAAARHRAHQATAHRMHRTTQVVTAIYQVTARPHAPRRRRAGLANKEHFAQGFDRSLMVES